MINMPIRPIGRAIVHDDDLIVGVGLRQDAVYRLLDIVPAVVGGDDDANAQKPSLRPAI